MYFQPDSDQFVDASCNKSWYFCFLLHCLPRYCFSNSTPGKISVNSWYILLLCSQTLVLYHNGWELLQLQSSDLKKKKKRDAESNWFLITGRKTPHLNAEYGGLVFWNLFLTHKIHVTLVLPILPVYWM